MILRRDRHGLRIDRQRAGGGRDHIVRRHVFRAVHDLPAFRDRVVPFRRVGNVRRAACRGSNERIAAEQRALRDRDSRVCQRRAVIRLFVGRRRDRDRHRGVRHRQLAVHRGNGVVVRVARRELIALEHIHNRALAREGNAPRHHRADRVAADKARN